MSETQGVSGMGTTPSGLAPATWWIVLQKELRDLWIGGKALYLTIIYCVIQGLYAYSMIRDSALSITPPKEMVFEMLEIGIAATLFICLVLGADSISGERERGTLEPLLLTPTSRRQIVVGKLLAAVSPWPVAFALSIPYWVVLAQGDWEAVRHTIYWGAILGGLMAPAMSGIGMLVSIHSISNKTSLFVSLGLYLFLLLPTQLPGTLQTGYYGALLQKVTPLAATIHFLGKLLVNNSTFERMWPWFASPATLALLTVGPLVLYFGPRLHFDTGRRSRMRTSPAVAGGAVIAAFALALAATPAAAVQSESAGPMQISIDAGAKAVKAGDPILFNTTLTNSGGEASAPLTVAMNIINLDAKGDVVDPEDWSPQRTQYLETLAPGESATLSWRVNAILAGDYMVYMVVIPKPAGKDATSQPVASSGIHLTVAPFTRLNPGGVLPFAIGVPILLLLGIVFLYRHRNRQIDAGGSQ